MTRVDFYILPDPSVEARERLACRLVEKAWRLGHWVYVHLESDAQGNRLSEQLWSFRPEAFIPHSHTTALNTGERARIQLGWGPDPGEHHDLLINLTLAVPLFHGRFERASELVCQDPAVLAASRENWKYYQQRGYPLQSHKL